MSHQSVQLSFDEEEQAGMATILGFTVQKTALKWTDCGKIPLPAPWMTVLSATSRSEKV